MNTRKYRKIGKKRYINNTKIKRGGGKPNSPKSSQQHSQQTSQINSNITTTQPTNNITTQSAQAPEAQGIIKPLAYMALSIVERGSASAVQQLSSILNVDASGKDIGKTLIKFNKALEDPQVRENLARFLVNLGNKVLLASKALEVPIKEATDKLLDIVDTSGKKAVRTIASIMLEAATAIPGLGSVIGAFIVADNMVKMGQSGINAVTGAVTTGIDATAEASANLEQMGKELEQNKEKTVQNILSQTESFNRGISNNELEKTSQPIQQQQQPIQQPIQPIQQQPIQQIQPIQQQQQPIQPIQQQQQWIPPFNQQKYTIPSEYNVDSAKKAFTQYGQQYKQQYVQPYISNLESTKQYGQNIVESGKQYATKLSHNVLDTALPIHQRSMTDKLMGKNKEDLNKNLSLSGKVDVIKGEMKKNIYNKDGTINIDKTVDTSTNVAKKGVDFAATQAERLLGNSMLGRAGISAARMGAKGAINVSGHGAKYLGKTIRPPPPRQSWLTRTRTRNKTGGASMKSNKNITQKLYR